MVVRVLLRIHNGLRPKTTDHILLYGVINAQSEISSSGAGINGETLFVEDVGCWYIKPVMKEILVSR